MQNKNRTLGPVISHRNKSPKISPKCTRNLSKSKLHGLSRTRRNSAFVRASRWECACMWRWKVAFRTIRNYKHLIFHQIMPLSSKRFYYNRTILGCQKVKTENSRLDQYWDKYSKLRAATSGPLCVNKMNLLRWCAKKDLFLNSAGLRFPNMTLLRTDGDILKRSPRNNTQEFGWNTLDNIGQRHKHASAAKQVKKTVCLKWTMDGGEHAEMGGSTPSRENLSTFLCETNLNFTKLTKALLRIFMKEEICRLSGTEIR